MKIKSILQSKPILMGMIFLAMFMLSMLASGSQAAILVSPEKSQLQDGSSRTTIRPLETLTRVDEQKNIMNIDALPEFSLETPSSGVNQQTESARTDRQIDYKTFTWDSYQDLQRYYRETLTNEHLARLQSALEENRNAMKFQKPLVDANLQKFFRPALPPELAHQPTRLILVIDEPAFQSTSFRNIVTNSLERMSSVKVVKTYQKLPIIVVEADGKELTSIARLTGIKAIFEDRFVQLIDPDWKPEKTVAVVPQWFGSEGTVGAFALHNMGINGSGVTVAIIDTGIDKTHPDLDDFDNNPSTNDPKVVSEASFIDFDGDGNPDVNPDDDIGHGTHVAGTVAANGNLIGMAPGAALMNAKVLYYGGAMLSWIVNGVDWAMNNGADIISMSLGGGPGFPEILLTSIVETAWDQGIVVTVAAGNSGPGENTVSAPGSASKIITVGASDVFNTTIFFSSRGSSPWGRVDPDVVAPGVEILSTLPDGTYGIYSGTSMATPHVAGAAALLLSANPNLTNEDVKRLLIATAQNQNEPANTQGAGRIDVLRAYQEMNQHPHVLFPNGNLVLSLSPGEQRTVSIDLLSNESLSITESLTGNVSSLFTWQVLPTTADAGQTTLTFTLSVPSNATPGTMYLGQLNFTNFEGQMSIEIHVDQVQNDGNTGTDAGDIFIDATALSLGNYSGMVNVLGLFNYDLDIYKFNFNKDETYLIELDGGADYSTDLDLLLFDANGSFLDYSASYTSQEAILHTASYTGTYYVMIYTYFSVTDAFYDLRVNIGQSTSIIPTANLLSYSDAGIDEDNDGKFDFLQIDITLEVSISGVYDILYILAENRSDYQLGRYDVEFIWETVYLESGGPQVVHTRIDGHLLRNTMYNGTYVIGEILVGDPTTYTVLADEFNVHETAAYNHTDFNSVTYYLTDISDSLADTDGDGINDSLRVTVTLYSQSSTVVNGIELPFLITDDWNSVFYIFVMVDNVVLNAGTNDIIFDIEGDLLGNVNYTGSFLIPYIGFYDYLPELDTDFFYYSIWYLTNAYNTTDFRQPSLVLLSTTDDGVDTDSNGHIDYIEVKINIDVKRTGTYQVIPASNYLINIEQQRVYLMEMSTPNVTIEDYFYGDLIVQFGAHAGKNTIVYRLPADLIKERGANGTLLIPNFYVVKLLNEYDFSIEMAFNVKTQAYNMATFEDPKIQYLNKYWVEKHDAKFNDGRTDSIQITLAFQVNTAGTYDLALSILDHQTWGWWVYDVITSKKTFDTPGEYNWSILIDGKELYLTKMDLSIELLLLQVGTLETPTSPYDPITFSDLQVLAYSIGITPLYNWEEFKGSIPVSFTGKVTTTPVDANSNGLYEQVIFDIEVDVLAPVTSTTEVDFGLFSMNGSYFEINIDTIDSFTQVGLQNISITVDARIFVVMLAADSPYELFVGLWNASFDYWNSPGTPQIDYLETIITGFALEDFEYTPPVEVVDILDDYLPSDSTRASYTSNAGIIFLMEVNSSVAEDYYFVLEGYMIVEEEYYTMIFSDLFTSDQISLAVGSQEVEVLIDLRSYFYYPPDPSANISMQITNVFVTPSYDILDSVSRWNGFYETNRYSAGDFDFSYGYPSTNIIFGSFTWRIEDANLNGKSDGITLTGSITNNDSNNYALGFDIAFQFGNDTLWLVMTTGPLVEVESYGTTTFSIPIDASLIAFIQSLSNINTTIPTSFTLNTDKDLRIIIEEVNVYLAGTSDLIDFVYPPSDWETDPIALTNFEIYERATVNSANAPQLVDDEGDGDYEYLSITVSVTINEAGYYTPIVIQWADDARSYSRPVTSQRYYGFYLTEGTHDIDLIIDGIGLLNIQGTGGFFDVMLMKTDQLFDFIDYSSEAISTWITYMTPQMASSDIPDTVIFPDSFDTYYDPQFDSSIINPLLRNSTFVAIDGSSGTLMIETLDDTKAVVFLGSTAIGDIDSYSKNHDFTLTNLNPGTTYTVIIELINKDLRTIRRTYQFTFNPSGTATSTAATSTSQSSPEIPNGGVIPGFELITVILGISLVTVIGLSRQSRRRRT